MPARDPEPPGPRSAKRPGRGLPPRAPPTRSRRRNLERRSDMGPAPSHATAIAPRPCPDSLVRRGGEPGSSTIRAQPGEPEGNPARRGRCPASRLAKGPMTAAAMHPEIVVVTREVTVAHPCYAAGGYIVLTPGASAFRNADLVPRDPQALLAWCRGN